MSSMKRISTKSRINRIKQQTFWKQFLAMLMIICTVSASAACKKSNVPSKKQIYNKVMKEEEHIILQEPGVFTYEELCKAWGKPDVERTTDMNFNYRAWKYEGRYIYAILESYSLNAVHAFGISTRDQLIYSSHDKDYAFFEFQGGSLMLDMEYIEPDAPNEAEFGDSFDIEYTGVILQSSPAQLEIFFSVTPADKAD